MSRPVLAIDGLSIAAGGRSLLDALALQLHAGECLGLVGESGSGKSLTALALLGLLPAGLRAQGQLRHEDRAIALGSPAHAALRGRVLGWVPQDPLASLHPLRSVGAQLVETLRVLRGLSRPRRGARPKLCSLAYSCRNLWRPCAATRTNSPAVNASASPSPWRWRRNRACWSRMSRRRRWMRASPATSSTCSTHCGARRDCRCC